MITNFRLYGTKDRAEGLGTAQAIWGLMNRANRRGTRMPFEVTRNHDDGERCAHPGSVYANLKAAL